MNYSNHLAIALVLIPLVLALTLFVFRPKEKTAAMAGSLVAGLGIVVSLAINILELKRAYLDSQASLRLLRNFSIGAIQIQDHYQLKLDFMIDSYSLGGILLIAVVAGMIIRFSRHYLHRENGFTRYFSIIFLFVSGLNLLVLAANPDLLFAAWELVGISSFLLIGFYWERTQPIIHALWVYGIYRFCDLGLFIGSWLEHHSMNGPFTFSELAKLPPDSSFAIGLLIILAAAGKSAQFPFTGWLTKAMEGPTASSAAFYGALSVHAGVFLLLRFLPVWIHSTEIRILMGLIGMTTTVICTLSSRYQANMKGHIAHASAAQVGLMLVELSLGLESVAVWHLVGNALFRCYQILLAPWAVTILVKEQRKDLSVNRHGSIGSWGRFDSTVFVLGLNEFFLDQWIKRIVTRPITRSGSWIAKPIDRISSKALASVVFPSMVLALLLEESYRVPQLHAVFALIGTLSAWIALGICEKNQRTWDFSAMSFFWMALAVAMKVPEAHTDFWIYGTGISLGWLVGKVAMSKIKPGQAYETPVAWAIWFSSSLALTGFPLFPTFIGEDLLLHHIVSQSPVNALGLCFVFVAAGISTMRLVFFMSFDSKWKRTKEAEA